MGRPFVERSEFLARALGQTPKLPDSIFSPRFLARASVAQVEERLAHYHGQLGEVDQVEVVGPVRPATWVLRWHYRSGARQLHRIAVESSPPYRIRTLFFGPPWVPDEEDTTPRTQTAFRLPFKGRWHVTWGGRTLEDNYHRIEECQRFAYDFSMVLDGVYCIGDGEANEDHYCFSEDILAPAGGRVVRSRDGIPDNAFGQNNKKEPLGNYVVIKHCEGEFSFLAHLEHTSVLVQEGEDVAQGQKVGCCGNSGSSSKPHLHFHVQNSPSLSTGTGLPPRFMTIWTSRGDQNLVEPRRGDWVENL